MSNEFLGRTFFWVMALLLLAAGRESMNRWFDLQDRQIQADMSSVDTVNIHTTSVDTLYIERPADTVKVTIKEVGELTEADMVDILCPPNFRETKEFWHNALGMVACHNPERK